MRVAMVILGGILGAAGYVWVGFALVTLAFVGWKDPKPKLKRKLRSKGGKSHLVRRVRGKVPGI